MGDAAGHLSQRAQALLLEHGLLGLPQVFVCALQRCVQIRLACGESHVFAQLAQEFAFAAAEAVGFATCGHEHAQHFSLHAQRRDDQCAQTLSRETPGQLPRSPRHVGFIEQLPGDVRPERARVLQTDPTLVDRKVLFNIADDDLNDAVEVLSFGDRPRDVIQQAHAPQLCLELALGDFAPPDLLRKRIDARRELGRPFADALLELVSQARL